MDNLGVAVAANFDDVRAMVARWRDALVPSARRRAVHAALEAAVVAARDATPVQTGRARAGWTAALDRLGAAERESAGALSARGEGRLLVVETDTSSERAAENDVPYIALLEFGDRGRPPAGMVRRGLLAAGPTFRTELLRAFAEE